MKIVLLALLLLCAFLVCVIIVKVYHSTEKKSDAITNSPVQGYDPSFSSYRVLGGGMDSDDTCDESMKGFNGSEYKGCQDKTINKTPCVKWSSVSSKYKDWNHNYCRNPEKEKDTLWCFINKEGSSESCVPKISQSEINNLTTKLENTEKTLGKTLNELGKSNDKKHQAVINEHTANKEKTLAEMKLNTTRNSLDNLRTNTSDTINRLESENRTLETENTEIKEENSTLENDNKTLTVTKEKLENTNKKLNEINKIEEEENEDLINKVQALENQKNDFGVIDVTSSGGGIGFKYLYL